MSANVCSFTGYSQNECAFVYFNLPFDYGVDKYLGASQSKLMMGRLIHAKAEGTSGKHEVNIMANMAVKTNVHAKVEPVLDQERRRHQVSVPKGNSESGGSIQVH